MERSALLLAAAGVAALAVAAAAPASATPRRARDDDPEVVAMWHLNESPGATLMMDSSGYGHDGQISPDVQLGVQGDDKTAYGFHGEDAIVRVPSSASLNPGDQPLTISAYLDVPAGLAPGDYNVLEKGPADTDGGAYKLEIVGRADSLRFGYPDCAFNSDGAKDRVYGPESINDGKWHHVECHLTATSVYVSVDGVSGPVAPRTVGTIANSAEVTLGGKPNNTHFYSGLADDVSITVG